MRARLFDGKSAAAIAVDVTADAHGLVIDGIGHWPFSAIVLEPPGATHWRLHGPDEAMLELPLGAEASALIAPVGDTVGPTSARRWALLVAAALLVATGAYAATPWLSGVIAQRIPMRWERAWGDQSMRFLHDRICESPHQAEVLEDLRERLEGAGPSRHVFGVHLVDMGIVNAFAMPGGQIIIDKSLAGIMRSPEAFAGVLAHEIGHAHRRHGTQMLVRGALLTSLWQVTVGDYASIFVVDPATFYRIVNLRFSRTAESEADADGLAMLQAARIDPAAVATFFTDLAGLSTGATWMSSHPDSAERAKLFADAPAPPEGFEPAMSVHDWELLRLGCSVGATE